MNTKPSTKWPLSCWMLTVVVMFSGCSESNLQVGGISISQNFRSDEVVQFLDSRCDPESEEYGDASVPVPGGKNLDDGGKHGIPPLIWAVTFECESAVMELLKAGASIEKEVDGVGGPLWTAAGQNSVTMTKLLLEKGANPNAVSLGRTPFLQAVESNAWNTFKILLPVTADIERKDSYGFPAGTKVIASGYLDQMLILLDHGYRHDLPKLRRMAAGTALPENSPQQEHRRTLLKRLDQLIAEQNGRKTH